MNMKNKITTLILLMFCSLAGMAQVGIGTSSPNANAALELSSTSQGLLLPRMTTAERDAITLPAKGLTIFNTTLNTIQTNTGTSAAPNWKSLAGPTSGNGTAVVSNFICTTASAGTMTAGVAVSGVTQTITATVTIAGTYSITATANGVAFTGSGTFAGTGAQDVVLTATGTPTANGSSTFTLNTSPSCSFSRTTLVNPSTNGTAAVSAYANTAPFGNITVGVPVSGVTQTITATVTKVGTYSITTTTANGVTFAGTGTFTGTGSQSIILTASGTPVAAGSNSFTLNTTPAISFSRTTNPPNPPSSNGTAVVSAYTCNTASTGRLIGGGNPVSGVTQTITATVTTAGTYLLNQAANGVIFFASGTFAGTGSQDIVLTAVGTPSAVGTNTWTLNTTPNCSFTRTTVQPTTNGTAVVSAYASASSAGTMAAGVGVSGVTQTITATVTTVGTYDITATANGVTFAGSGTFAGTGAQSIVLTATGTPTYATTNTFTFNTIPSFSFSRTTTGGDATSNGTAVVSGYTCTTASAGRLIVGTPVSGVTQTITATVTTVGTYSISATANGVTYARDGTFAGTGSQNIVLTATGTPIAAGFDTATLNTTPNCRFGRYTSLTGAYANVGGTIKDFGRYNLGVTGTQDPYTYQSGNNNGALYQWGRQTDGHELRASTTQAGPVAEAVANRFITINASPNDWLNPQNDNLWGDGTTGASPAKAANDPCPTGFKVPSQAQWGGLFRTGTTSGAPGTATQNTWTWTGDGYTVGSNLYLPAAGFRTPILGQLSNVGSSTGNGDYWSTTVNGSTNGKILYFDNGQINPDFGSARARGCAVRCIAVDNISTNGTAVVSGYAPASSAGTMTIGVPVSGVTQTITATVTTAGTYGITTRANGVTFSAMGTFAGTGSQTIVLTATGTPTYATTDTYTLNISPNFSFNRTTTGGDASSNGSAVVSAYTCNTDSAGLMNAGFSVLGVTQTITATVTTVGNYSISATANGVTFAGAGTFAGTGAQNIVLTATGTPTAAGGNTFTLNTTPNCNFSRITVSGLLLHLDAGNPASYTGTASTWYDLSGYGNNGTNTGSATYSSSGNNGFFQFSGINYFTLDKSKLNVPYTGKTIIVSGFFPTNYFNTFRNFTRSTSGTRNFDFHLYWDVTANHRLYYSSNNLGPLSLTTTLTPNTWYVFAITHDISGEIRFYVNGTQLGTTQTGTFSQFDNSMNNFFVGLSWIGNIGTVLIYGKTLAPSEIMRNYNTLSRRF